MLPINVYPYLNLNDLNLDYILKTIGELRYEVTNFVSLNAIKYADPIQWDITRQYEKNTVVIDPLTGTAYISVAPVPMGVALTNTDYWCVVFDLGSFVTRAAQNFTSRWESETTSTATFATNTGEWLVWGDVLYKALTNITAGDTYVVGGNIDHFTIEDIYNAYLNTIANILAIVGDLVDLNTSDKTSIVNAINSVLVIIGDLADLNTSDKTSIVNAINSEIVARQNGDDTIMEYVNKHPFSNELSLQYINNLVSLDSRYAAFNLNRYNSVIQGMCINDDGNLICTRSDESDRDNYGDIDVYTTNGVRLSTINNVEFGHGNSITYANGFYYIGWLYDVNNGTFIDSNKITKISKDFGTISIITCAVRVSAISYSEDTQKFYVFDSGNVYVFDDDTFSAPSNVIALNETVLDTTHYINMARQNGTYYNGYWIHTYLYPTIMAWYDLTTGECIKVYNYPRRLIFNGMSTIEVENVVFNPNDEMFYSTFYARCGEGDVATNTFCKYSPYKNAISADDKYYGRHGLNLYLYVDPSISDNSFMDGSETYPFKYLQFAIDFALTFTDMAWEVRIKTSENYLGTVRASYLNGIEITLASGYTKDTTVTIPSIYLKCCNSFVGFNLHCDDINVDYCSNIQFAQCDIDTRLRINRTYDADVQLCTINTFLARICGLSLYNNTITTYTEDGTVVYKQENVKYLDCGYTGAVTVPAQDHIDVAITYNRPFNGTPHVAATLATSSTDATYLTSLTLFVADANATGCKLRFYNKDAQARTTGAGWIAFIK